MSKDEGLMSRLDLDAMEAVARGATEGPWYPVDADHEADYPTICVFDGDGIMVDVIAEVCSIKEDEDLKFFATFNPSAMLELLSRIRELEGALAWVREVHPVTGRAIDGYPAKVMMTWPQFNEMRIALGMKPLPTKHDPRARSALSKATGEGQ